MDIDLFRKVLGMLGSDQAGERSAAALKATRMLKESGGKWADVSVGGTDAAGPNALNRALEEIQSLKSGLAEVAARNRILMGQLEAMRQIEVKIAADPSEKQESPKRSNGFWWTRADGRSTRTA